MQEMGEQLVGIEAPEVRKSRGKPRVGTLGLRAHHEGGNVIIEVRDDGAGLDHDRIARKAVARGLIDEEQLASAVQPVLVAGWSSKVSGGDGADMI